MTAKTHDDCTSVNVISPFYTQGLPLRNPIPQPFGQVSSRSAAGPNLPVHEVFTTALGIFHAFPMSIQLTVSSLAVYTSRLPSTVVTRCYGHCVLEPEGLKIV
jgi:hypothetical protein